MREYGEGSGMGAAGRGSGRAGRRGGRGGGGTSDLGRIGTVRDQLEVNLGFTELQSLETKTCDEITLYLTSRQCFPVFTKTAVSNRTSLDYLDREHCYEDL